MLTAVARFEYRYQVRNPVFWVVGILFFLMAFAFVAVGQLASATGSTIHANAPVKIAQLQGIFSTFFLFASAAFVANIVLRDDETGFGPIVRSTRVSKAAYLIGRFAGAYAAAALLFLVVPLALWTATWMPWIDPDRLGPNRLAGYAYGYFILALPNIFVTSALFFALATATRSMLATYVGLVVLLVGNGFLGRTLAGMPQYETLRAYLSPFGNAALGRAVRYWTSAQGNAGVPAIDGLMTGNRLLWIGIGIAFIALAYRLFRFEVRGSRKARRAQALDARIAALPVPAPIARLPDPDFGRGAGLATLWLRTRFEIAQIVRSPAFPILLAIGVITGLVSLTNTEETYGTALLPATRIVIRILSSSFGLVSLIVAIFYAGELVWRERDRRIHEIIDASAMPDWAFVLPKLAALALVLMSILLFGTASGLLFQAARGYTAFEPAKYVLWFVLPFAVSWLLVGVLALFVQALSPNKYVGWGIMVLYFVGTIVADNFGWTSGLYAYASGSDMPLSDMNDLGGFWVGAWWFRLYWSAFAAMLLIVAHLLWRRGTDVRLRPRLARLPGRLRGPAGGALVAAGLVFVASGVWIYVNTHVRNRYLTTIDREGIAAAREKALLRYETVPQPAVSAIRMSIDLHPAALSMTATGRYTLVNRSGRPLSDIHVAIADDDTRLERLDLPGATLLRAWPEFGYRIYRLATPLAPGAQTTMAFRTQRATTGFRNVDLDTRLVRNGTFLQNAEIAPTLGFSRNGLLVDRVRRRAYGLPPELRMARLEDRGARNQNYIHADWVTSDITLSTDADQTPVAPGDRIADVTAGGRRTARFVATAPILNFWSIQSARYRERHADAGGRDLAVYYDAQHGRNAGRMLAAFRTALGYYESAFGPYQFDYARIVEFPDYRRYAQAFAGTMPYSEGFGFIADLSDRTKIDYVTYVAAHELAHQWWAHQVVGADMQGGTLLSETLAQYSALMVMERIHGPDQIRRFLKYELDGYLKGRGGDPIGEQPLARVENQQYIHYRKGAVAMYLLKDQLGQARVDAALARFMRRFRFRPAPYPRSLDLIAEFRRGATPGEQRLITDLFERITLYDLKAGAPRVRKRADGRYDVRFTATADKIHADAKGVETPARMTDEAIDVGLFTAMPGRGTFAARNVIRIVRMPISTGTRTLRFVTDRPPAFVGIDPYNKFVDRDSDDNVVPVTPG